MQLCSGEFGQGDGVNLPADMTKDEIDKKVADGEHRCDLVPKPGGGAVIHSNTSCPKLSTVLAASLDPRARADRDEIGARTSRHAARRSLTALSSALPLLITACSAPPVACDGVPSSDSAGREEGLTTLVLTQVGSAEVWFSDDPSTGSRPADSGGQQSMAGVAEVSRTHTEELAILLALYLAPYGFLDVGVTGAVVDGERRHVRCSGLEFAVTAAHGDQWRLGLRDSDQFGTFDWSYTPASEERLAATDCKPWASSWGAVFSSDEGELVFTAGVVLVFWSEFGQPLVRQCIVQVSTADLAALEYSQPEPGQSLNLAEVIETFSLDVSHAGAQPDRYGRLCGSAAVVFEGGRGEAVLGLHRGLVSGPLVFWRDGQIRACLTFSGGAPVTRRGPRVVSGGWAEVHGRTGGCPDDGGDIWSFHEDGRLAHFRIGSSRFQSPILVTAPARADGEVQLRGGDGESLLRVLDEARFLPSSVREFPRDV